jgi:hypothetical protein
VLSLVACPIAFRRLGHPTLTQQHHLDALALRRRYLPAQRSFQPPHLGLAAFDHLFPPNQMAQANHTSGEENSPRLSAKNPDSSRYGGSIRRTEWRMEGDAGRHGTRRRKD